jgi:hypothetical protein
MDAISRDLRTYGGVTAAARARASGISVFFPPPTPHATHGKSKDGHEEAPATTSLTEADQAAITEQLTHRGIGQDDAEHLMAAAVAVEAKLEQARQLWSTLQRLAGELHIDAGALADDIRVTDDALRSALGRKSKQLPLFGIKPIAPHAHRAPAPAATEPMAAASAPKPGE